MKKSRILWKVLKTVGADKIVTGYVGFFLLAALAIFLSEPAIKNYGDGLWFCFNVATTIGLGDFTAVTVLGRIFVVLLSLYSVFVVALIPTVLVNFYLEVNRAKQDESTLVLIDKLSNLENLPKDELKKLSEKIRSIVKK